MEKLKKIGNGLIGGVILYIINILRAWTIHNMDFPELENVFFFLDLFGIFIAVFLILYKQTTTKDSIVNASVMILVWTVIQFWGERYVLKFLNREHPYDSNGYGMIIVIYMMAIIVILVCTILIKAFVRFCKGH